MRPMVLNGAAPVTLCGRQKASDFWIMLLLVSGTADHGWILHPAHTYICMRLLQGADVYQIAKNCRTSVEMIQKFYAAHMMNYA